MAHVVGVPRRDPCRKCQLPVFLAERLLVGKKVYHRTCLKCARCNSQLTPGSFYETEIDEQYCCETCPDEEITQIAGAELTGATAAAVGGNDTFEADSSEVQLRNTFERDALRSPNTAANTRSVRSSIKDRLAFFEQQQQNQDGSSDVDSKLLQKSLSDEEKSKSLQRMETTAPAATYRMNPALTSFLNDTYDTVDNEPEERSEHKDEEEDESESLASSMQNPQMDTSDSEEADDLHNSSQPPELPKSLPPSEVAEKDNKPEDTKRFTASAQLVLGTTTTTTTNTTTTTEPQVIADEQENIIPTSTAAEKQITELQISVSSSRKTNDDTNNNLHDSGVVAADSALRQETEEREKPQLMTETIQQQIELDNNLACKETNDNDCVTKDKATVDVSMETEAETVAAQQFESTTTSHDQVVATKSIQLPAEEQKPETSEHQVELRTKTAEDRAATIAAATASAAPAEDKATTERLSVVRARLQQFEVITNNEKENIKETKTATNDNKQPKDISPAPIPQAMETNENEALSRLDIENENAKSPVQIKEIISIDTPTETESINEKEKETEMEMEKDTDTEKDTETKIVTVTIKEPQSELEQETDIEYAPQMTAETTDIVTEGTESSKAIVQEVPLPLETKDNDDDILLNNSKEISHSNETPEQQHEEETTLTTALQDEDRSTMPQTPGKIAAVEQYPEDLNPFQSDDDEDNKENMVQLRNSAITQQQQHQSASTKASNLNPFDSSDDEIELEKSQSSMTSTPKIPPPRPPPPRISRNPFGSEDEDEAAQNFPRRSSLTASQSKRTPVPTPRSNVSQSQNPTPEPTPRLSTKLTTNLNQHNNSLTNTTASATTTPQSSSYVLQNSSDFYGSANSLHSNHYNNNNSTTTPNNLLRNSDIRSSNNSLNLSAGGTIRSRKSRRAPLPPAPVKELFPSTETINSSSKTSTPSSSTVGTPKSGRKKRPAPAPPKPARLEPSAIPQFQVDTIETRPKNSLSYPLQSELDSKLSDEEKALLEGKTLQSLHTNDSDITLSPASRRSSKRLIPLDKELQDEHGNQSQCDDLKQQQNLQKSYNYPEGEEANVVYRRLLIPHNIDTPTHESNPLIDELNRSSNNVGERQLEKLKDNKEANNRNRQSQISAASSGGEDNDPLFNKSVHGKWKRRKGPAPALPIPPRKVLQMLPLQEIKHELDIIEVQQQGLEKQGVILEKMIRDRCEGQNGEPLNAEGEVATPGESTTDGGSSTAVENSKEVEYLILQLFELVNEKNELFRRQAELMYLRRQHRLEQEQADLEYEIRVLMAQPERNKTDSDKAREEALIERLVEVVQLRNEVVECLEMDRIREAEEDQSIKQRLESHIAQREDEPESKKSSTSKLSKKEKKKQKEAKKLGKSKKIDADKDADESEINLDKQKTKKKKKLLIF